MKEILMLWELQELEKKEKTLSKALKSIPEAGVLKKLKEEIESLQVRIKTKIDELKKVEKKLRGFEDDIAGLKEKLVMLNDGLYSAGDKTAKELEAEQTKTDALGKDIKIRENSALTLMEQVEALNAEIREMMKELEIKKDSFRKNNTVYQEKRQSFNEELNEVTTTITGLRNNIKEDDVEEYQRLCRRFDDREGIVKIKDNMCSGCHMVLSFDSLKKIKEHPIYCDNCGRLVIGE